MDDNQGDFFDYLLHFIDSINRVLMFTDVTIYSESILMPANNSLQPTPRAGLGDLQSMVLHGESLEASKGTSGAAELKAVRPSLLVHEYE